MNNLNANYERILEVLRKMSNENLLSYQRRVPKLKDLELKKAQKSKRIETLFFQLVPVMIRGNYAKRFEGFKTRLLTKITALIVVQFINKTRSTQISII